MRPAEEVLEQLGVLLHLLRQLLLYSNELPANHTGEMLHLLVCTSFGGGMSLHLLLQPDCLLPGSILTVGEETALLPEACVLGSELPDLRLELLLRRELLLDLQKLLLPRGSTTVSRTLELDDLLLLVVEVLTKLEGLVLKAQHLSTGRFERAQRLTELVAPVAAASAAAAGLALARMPLQSVAVEEEALHPEMPRGHGPDAAVQVEGRRGALPSSVKLRCQAAAGLVSLAGLLLE
mmetsp:Transcript_90245/g.269258  ORF Transcript_90245/g.269258 Transcript_90245/m.269258 type:complete len:236 (-) Transcript_90245:368-1075(-)